MWYCVSTSLQYCVVYYRGPVLYGSVFTQHLGGDYLVELGAKVDMREEEGMWWGELGERDTHRTFLDTHLCKIPLFVKPLL